ncbi:MAG: cyclase family protein [Actinobacteria bacterium]|nr:cyclase family protein [Actinomycetota bacterium]
MDNATPKASVSGRFIDLTMPFSSETIPVPGHPAPTFEPLHTIERDGVRNTVVCMSLHTGTHIDAPSHFIPDGRTIDQIELDRFRRPAVRLDLTGSMAPGEPIDLEQLRRAGFDPGAAADSILLLATGWTDRAWREPALYETNPFLASDAAEAVAACRPSVLGLDFAVDDTRPWPNHTVLLGEEVLLLENLVGLPRLPADGFEVTAFPLHLVGENGGPARVVAELSS